MRVGRVLGAVAALPIAFAALLGVEAAVASRREYVPDDPGYLVQARVEPRGSSHDGAPLRLVMLGDSTVAGLGSPTAESSLAVLTAQRVADRLGRSVEVRGLGVSGARTADVRDEQLPQVSPGEVDVLVVVVGSNDVTHLTPPWHFDDVTRSMLERARAAGAPVILGGIPLFGGVTALDQPLRWAVDRSACVLRGIQVRTAQRVRGVTFVDIAAQASPRFVGVPDAMSSDGFHPAPTGYGFWADALAPAAADAAG
ncbi:MAG: hypothetical protein GEU74_04745 [Nitriliruptorales bacterium]|nr:hypothetical protein [Nitriliruptorales bacterium]